MVPQEKFGWFIGTKGGSDFGIKDSEGSESEEHPAVGVLQQIAAAGFDWEMEAGAGLEADCEDGAGPGRAGQMKRMN